MDDSSFVLFGVAALFFIGFGWFLVLDERTFSQEEESEAAANLVTYQRRYNDRIAVLAEQGGRREPEAATSARLSA